MLQERFSRALLTITALVVIASIGYAVITWKTTRQTSEPLESVTVVFQPCDIDRDGDCDADDFELLTNVIGECIEGDNYNEVADADHDGCVTVQDQKQLFPITPQD